MKKLVVVLLIALVALAACGGNNNATTASNSGLKDGTYFATYSAVDSHAWQPLMRMTVQKGKITKATFDYVNAAGDTLKTNDQGYADRMGQITGGMTPAKASEQIDQKVVAAQSADFDAVTGATSSSGWAKELTARLVEAARNGNTSDIIIPMHETYTAEDQADDHGGWIGHLEVTFGENGNITNVSYDEVTKDDKGAVTARKSEDKAYAERYSAKSGFTQDVAYKKLQEELASKNELTAVDAVSGATGTSDRFNALVQKIKDARVTVSPSTIKGLLK